MPGLRWFLADPGSGNVIDELPGLTVQTSLQHFIGRGEKASFGLPMADRLPAAWISATQPARALLVGCYDDDQQTVLWVGFIESVVRGGDVATLNAVELEGLLDRLPMGTAEFAVTEQATILRALGLDLIAVNFHGTVQVIPTGITLDRTYSNDDDQSRLSCMQDLMRLPRGPEFTIYWTWDANGALVALPTTAPLLGRRATPDAPAFVLSGAEWTQTIDYSEGKGATIVTATAVRQGDQRLSVTRQATELLAAGYLPIEYRFAPDVSASTEADLVPYAEQKLADIRYGTPTYSITVPVETFTVGRDVSVGDDLDVDLVSLARPEMNQTIRGRMVGWTAEVDKNTQVVTKITPTFQGDDDDA